MGRKMSWVCKKSTREGSRAEKEKRKVSNLEVYFN